MNFRREKPEKQGGKRHEKKPRSEFTEQQQMASEYRGLFATLAGRIEVLNHHWRRCQDLALDMVPLSRPRFPTGDNWNCLCSLFIRSSAHSHVEMDNFSKLLMYLYPAPHRSQGHSMTPCMYTIEEDTLQHLIYMRTTKLDKQVSRILTCAGTNFPGWRSGRHQWWSNHCLFGYPD